MTMTFFFGLYKQPEFGMINPGPLEEAGQRSHQVCEKIYQMIPSWRSQKTPLKRSQIIIPKSSRLESPGRWWFQT